MLLQPPGGGQKRGKRMRKNQRAGAMGAMGGMGAKGATGAWARCLRMLGAALAMTVLAALAACASRTIQGLSPGLSTDEVSRRAGPPDLQVTLPEGGSAWFYINGPLGWTTYRAQFDGEKRLIVVEQVLTEGQFTLRILPRRTHRDQVLRWFGTPGEVARYPQSGEEVWQYRYLATSRQMICLIRFDAQTGIVKGYKFEPDPAYVNAGDG
jgi:hypothetical protein